MRLLIILVTLVVGTCQVRANKARLSLKILSICMEHQLRDIKALSYALGDPAKIVDEVHKAAVLRQIARRAKLRSVFRTRLIVAGRYLGFSALAIEDIGRRGRIWWQELNLAGSKEKWKACDAFCAALNIGRDDRRPRLDRDSPGRTNGNAAHDPRIRV